MRPKPHQSKCHQKLAHFIFILKVRGGALRLSPDRLVVGDLRGIEALELLSAMASVNDGTVAAINSGGATSALERFASFARLSGPGASLEALRELVASAVDVVVHVATFGDGVSRIAGITEVLGVKNGAFVTEELFTFASDGEYVANGRVPEFYRELEILGMPHDTTIFRK